MRRSTTIEIGGMPAKMNLTAVWIATAWLASVTSPAAAAPDAASASAFVEKLYSHYPPNPNGKAFDPTGKDAREVFPWRNRRPRKYICRPT